MRRNYKYAYQKLIDTSNLLKDVRLKVILEDILEGNSFSKFKPRLEGDFVLLSEENEKKVYLDLTDVSPVFIKCNGGDLLEKARINLNEGVSSTKVIDVDCVQVENRPFGVIVTERKRWYFGEQRVSKEEFCLEEKEYVYKNETLGGKELFCFRGDMFATVSSLLESQIYPEFQTNLKISVMDLKDLEGDCLGSDVQVMMNGKDISYLYDCLDGSRVVSRIFQLYHGMITKRNSRDIFLIHLGKLSEDAFGFRQLEGINYQENFLVGSSDSGISKNDLAYVQKFFLENFGVECQDFNSRIGLLKCIKRLDGTVVLDEDDYSVLENLLEDSKADSNLEDLKKKGVRKKLFRFAKKKNIKSLESLELLDKVSK